MRRPREKKQADPRPVMPRGETEFEEKRIQAEFTLVFSKASKTMFTSLSDSYEWVFRQGYFTGKIVAKREQGGESIPTPHDASVRETAGAQRRNDGVTKSD